MNALTVMQNAQVAVAAQVTRPQIRSMRKLVEAIRDQYATSDEVRYFVSRFGEALNKNPAQLYVVQRALARALYREGEPLSFAQLVMISGMTETQVRGHMRFLNMTGDVLTNMQASRIMCRNAVE